jgi:hypothetical protein
MRTTAGLVSSKLDPAFRALRSSGVVTMFTLFDFISSESSSSYGIDRDTRVFLSYTVRRQFLHVPA